MQREECLFWSIHASPAHTWFTFGLFQSGADRGFSNAVSPQSKQEWVVVLGFTSDCASLWLLIMLRLLGVLRLFGVRKEYGHLQKTRT